MKDQLSYANARITSDPSRLLTAKYGLVLCTSSSSVHTGSPAVLYWHCPSLPRKEKKHVIVCIPLVKPKFVYIKLRKDMCRNQ